MSCRDHAGSWQRAAVEVDWPVDLRVGEQDHRESRAFLVPAATTRSKALPPSYAFSFCEIGLRLSLSTRCVHEVKCTRRGIFSNRAVKLSNEPVERSSTTVENCLSAVGDGFSRSTCFRLNDIVFFLDIIEFSTDQVQQRETAETHVDFNSIPSSHPEAQRQASLIARATLVTRRLFLQCQSRPCGSCCTIGASHTTARSRHGAPSDVISIEARSRYCRGRGEEQELLDFQPDTAAQSKQPTAYELTTPLLPPPPPINQAKTPAPPPRHPDRKRPHSRTPRNSISSPPDLPAPLRAPQRQGSHRDA